MSGFEWLLAGWAIALVVAWVLILTVNMNGLWTGPLCLVGLVAGGAAGRVYGKVRR